MRHNLLLVISTVVDVSIVKGTYLGKFEVSCITKNIAQILQFVSLFFLRLFASSTAYRL